MPQFDLSVIKTFNIPGDAVNIYLMLDESIVTAATAGLSAAAKAVVNAYRFVPTAAQLASGAVPGGWAGNDPPAIYFKMTSAKAQAALARWYK